MVPVRVYDTLVVDPMWVDVRGVIVPPLLPSLQLHPRRRLRALELNPHHRPPSPGFVPRPLDAATLREVRSLEASCFVSALVQGVEICTQFQLYCS